MRPTRRLPWAFPTCRTPSSRATATINDDDTAGITVAPTNLATSEAGLSAAFNVILTSQPTSEVSIGLLSSNTSEGTVSPSSLVFTPQNWSQAQTATVTGVDALTGTVRRSASTSAALSVALSSSDLGAATLPASISIPAGQASASFTITAVDDAVADAAQSSTLTASAQGFTSATAQVEVTNDDTAGIAVTPTQGLVTSEARGQSSFTIALASQPTSDVSIGLSSSNTREGTVSPSTCTFALANWSQPQAVTVAGADDLVADGEQNYSIITAPAQSADPGYNGREAADVSLSNLDNDAPGLTLFIEPASVTEGGAATGRISRNSVGEATVLLSSSDTSQATTPAQIVIPAGQLSATFAIQAQDDAIANGTRAVTITASAGGFASAASLAVLDNDAPGILLTPTAGLSTSEAGQSAAFSVRLLSQPTSDVVIGLSSSDVGEGTASTSTCTFGPGNWDMPQTVVVTGVDDTVVDGARPYSIITGRAQSADANYNGLDADDVALTNADDDAPALSLSLSAASIAENGGALGATGTLRRNFQLGSALTVALSSTLAEVTLPPTVTFAPGTASATFSIGVLDNAVAEGNRSTTISASVAGLSAVQTLAVADDESLALSLSLAVSSAPENQTKRVRGTVTRNSPASSALTVALSSSDTSEARVPPSVTIPSGSASATFALVLVDDVLADGPQSVTIGAQASGFGAWATVGPTVTDNEKPALSLSFKPERLAENGASVATLRRNTEITSSTRALTVTLAMSPLGQATVPRSVTIPARAASVSFAVRATDDRLVDGPRIVTLTARAPGLLPGAADVIVGDNEAASSAGIGGQVQVLASGSGLGSALGLPVPGVTLTLRRGAVAMDRVLSASNGAYVLRGLPVGSYTITPSKPGYNFAPASRAVTISRAGLVVGGINFVGTPRAQVSGVLTTLDGDGVPLPLANALVVARGVAGSFSARTNSAGAYLLDRLPLGSYTMAPSQAGTFFGPKSRAVALTPGSPLASGADFTASGSDAVPPSVAVRQPGASSFSLAARSALAASGVGGDNAGGSGLAAVTVALGRFASVGAASPNGLWKWSSRSFAAADNALVESLARGTSSWSLDPAALSSLRTLPAGSYGIRAAAVDNAGNARASAWKKFSITGSASAREVAGRAGLPEMSPIRLSSARDLAAQSQIVLAFTGALDAATTSDAARYEILLDGTAVEIEGALSAGGTVTLSLPASTWRPGSVAQVIWHGLLGARGRLMADEQATIVAR